MLPSEALNGVAIPQMQMVVPQEPYQQKGYDYNQYVGDAIKHIKKYEGFRNHAYKIPGEKFWTIGYGRKAKGPKEVTNRDKEEKWIHGKVSTIAKGVYNNVINKMPTASKHVAVPLISAKYNLSPRSYGIIRELMKQGKYQAAADTLRQMYYGSGRVMRGLIPRRKEEADQLTKGIADLNQWKIQQQLVPSDNSAWTTSSSTTLYPTYNNYKGHYVP